MKKIKYGILVLVLMFIFINNVDAKIDVNSGSGSGNTSAKCNTGICANTITDYYGLSVKVCSYDSKNEKFNCEKAKEITNSNFSFSEPKDCKTVEDGSNYLNYCWSEYFKQMNENEVNRLLKKVNSKYNTSNKKDYYLVVEPLVGVKLTYYSCEINFFGTASEVTEAMYNAGNHAPNQFKNDKNGITEAGRHYVLKRKDGKVKQSGSWQNSEVIGGEWNVLRNYYTSFKLDKAQGQYKTSYKNIDNKTAYDFANNISSTKYGKVIIKISDFITTPEPEPEPTPDPDLKCEIGKNDNDNEKYNWIKYNSSSQQMEPIVGGCCSSYAKYGITEGDVKQKYPQCFENPCTEKTESMGSQCTSSSKGSASIKQSLSSNYCYVSKKYYSGVIDATNRIFYGCTYEDSLSLPQGFKNNLNQGSHFIWPTNEELLIVSPVDLDYEITRTSTATCYAYQVQKSTGYSVAYNVNNLNNAAREKIKETIIEKVDKNDISVTQNGQVSGILTNEFDGSEFVPYDSTTGFFDVRVYSSYNQNLDSKSNSNSYRYYDNSSLSYLRYKDIKDTDNIKYYKKYPYMLLPVSNNFDIKKDYIYGLSYETDFAGLKMSNTYKCSLKVNNKKESCICPVGTDNAGLDLSNYSKTDTGGTGECSVSNRNECAVLIDEYCNNKNISYSCPNIDYDLTGCVKDKLNSSPNMLNTKAYNECVDEKCSCTSDDCDYKKICDPDTNDEASIIYRTIFLNNPFIKQNGSIRIPGSNWGGNLSISSDNKYTGLVHKYITSTKDKMYKGKAMYTFELTPEIIRYIKNYNEGKEYSDFALECDDTNGRCYSKFLHNDLEKVISGTCGSIKNKKTFQTKFYSCREEVIR